MATVAGATETVKKTLGHALRFTTENPKEKTAVFDFRPYISGYPKQPYALILTEIVSYLNSRAIDLHRPLRVLNLGCRTGLITQAIALAGHRALGVDPDPERIRTAHAFSQKQRLDGIFLQADPIRDPLWERPAEEILGAKPDAVVLVDFLNTLPQVEYFIDRLSRWLGKDALLIVGERNPDALSYKLSQLALRRKETRGLRNFQSWRRILESNDFAVSDSLKGFDRFGFLSRPGTRAGHILFHATKRAVSNA